MLIDGCVRSQQGCSSYEVNPVLFRKMRPLSLGLYCATLSQDDFFYSRIRDTWEEEKYRSGVKYPIHAGYPFPIKEKGAQ